MHRWLYVWMCLLVLWGVCGEAAAPPDPTHLDPNWWNEYLVGNEQLVPYILVTEEALKKVLEATPEKEREATRAQIQRILINLKALPQLREQKVPAAVLPPFRDSYTIDEQFELLTLIRKLEGELAAQKKEVSQLVERGARVRQHIDSLFASYLQQREPTLAKQEMGLEIMALRMALSITEENIRFGEQRVTKVQEELNHAREAWKVAEDHLAIEKIDATAFDRRLDKARSALRIASNASLRAEMAALGAPGDTATERARSYWLTQKAVSSDVEEALLRIDVIGLQIRRELGLYLVDPEQVDASDLSSKVDVWLNELNDVKAQLPDWESKTQQELERASQPSSTADSQDIQAATAKDAPRALGDGELDRWQQQRYQQVQETLKNLRELQLRLLFSKTMLQQLQKRYLAQGGTAPWFHFLSSAANACCDPFVCWMQTPLFKMGGVPITVLSLLRSIVIMGAALLLSFFLRRLLKRVKNQQIGFSDAYVFLVNRLIHYTVLFLGFALAIASMGLNLSNLALVLGALSVGIGFGLQNIVNNFVSSLILLFSRTLRIGDHIELDGGQTGLVTAINIQNTVVHTGDGLDIIVPNSTLLSHRLNNWTLEDNFKKLHIPFTIGYDADRELVCRIVCEAAARVPCTVMNSPHHSNPEVWLTRFEESAIACELVVWVNVYGYGHRGSMISSYNWEIDSALSAHGVSRSSSLNVRPIKDQTLP